MFKSRRLYAACLAAAGLAAMAATPALADTIVAPAGDLAGLWGAFNGWLAPTLATVATGAVAWGAKAIAGAAKVHVSAGLEEQVRQTALTGLYQAAHAAEIKIDGSITAQQRARLISAAVTWVMGRMPLKLGQLGIGSDVVSAIVTKMLGQAIAGIKA